MMRLAPSLAAAAFVFGPAATAQTPDPAVLSFKLPGQIAWTGDPDKGPLIAKLWGDPDKPGPYAVLVKWPPHRMSRPHFHANDRFSAVVKGTWWVGSGPKFDPANTTPMPTGSFITHFGKQVHWDGVKDEEAVLLIMGEGPATAFPAEEK